MVYWYADMWAVEGSWQSGGFGLGGWAKTKVDSSEGRVWDYSKRVIIICGSRQWHHWRQLRQKRFQWRSIGSNGDRRNGNYGAPYRHWHQWRSPLAPMTNTIGSNDDHHRWSMAPFQWLHWRQSMAMCRLKCPTKGNVNNGDQWRQRHHWCQLSQWRSIWENHDSLVIQGLQWRQFGSNDDKGFNVDNGFNGDDGNNNFNDDSGNIGANGDKDDLEETIMIHQLNNGPNGDNNANGDSGFNSDNGANRENRSKWRQL